MRHDPAPTTGARSSGAPTSAGAALDEGARGRPARGVAFAGRALGAVLGAMVVAVVAATGSAAYGAGATVNVATTANFGPVLTNAAGLALYTFPSDHNGISTCTGACVPVWPALTVPAGTTPTAGTGVTGTVAAVLQGNGTYQVTYNGAPLYTFVGDTAPGQVTGNNIAGFKVVQVAAAAPSTTAPAPTAPATTSPAPTTPASSAPAPATPVTSVPASPAPTTPAVQGATPPAPAVQSASSAAATPAAPTAPTATSLAVTGPGPGLVWILVVGAVLVLGSATTLFLLGDGARLPRTVASRARRAGGWLLGR